MQRHFNTDPQGAHVTPCANGRRGLARSRYIRYTPFGRRPVGSAPILSKVALRLTFSPAVFEEFILPYDQELLERFGGGCIHACGRADHFAPLLPAIRGLGAFNLSLPHLNDMDRVLGNTIDKGLLLLGLPRDAAESIRSGGRQLRGRAHGP